MNDRCSSSGAYNRHELNFAFVFIGVHSRFKPLLMAMLSGSWQAEMQLIIARQKRQDALDASASHPGHPVTASENATYRI